MNTKNQFLKPLLILFLVFITIGAKAQTTNFSGKWTLDTGKTDFGQAPKFVISHALQVTQTSAGLMVDRTNLTTQGEEKHYMQQMTFDGKPSQTVTITGNNESDVLSWSADKANLVLAMNVTSTDSKPLAKFTETWSLTDGGKTLVIDRQVEQPDGFKYGIKGYYQKQ